MNDSSNVSEVRRMHAANQPSSRSSGHRLRTSIAVVLIILVIIAAAVGGYLLLCTDTSSHVPVVVLLDDSRDTAGPPQVSFGTAGEPSFWDGWRNIATSAGIPTSGSGVVTLYMDLSNDGLVLSFSIQASTADGRLVTCRYQGFDAPNEEERTLSASVTVASQSGSLPTKGAVDRVLSTLDSVDLAKIAEVVSTLGASSYLRLRLLPENGAEKDIPGAATAYVWGEGGFDSLAADDPLRNHLSDALALAAYPMISSSGETTEQSVSQTGSYHSGTPAFLVVPSTEGAGND